jgi:stigma-specific protein Stig1
MNRLSIALLAVAFACERNQNLGQDECRPDRTICGGECVDLHSDPDHCGACDSVCPSAEVCLHSECATSCATFAFSPTDCDRACVDLFDDDYNCGGCGNACPTNQYCEEAACRSCPSGQTYCLDVNPAGIDKVCVDLQTNTTHCGTCENACVITGVPSCVDGMCVEGP